MATTIAKEQLIEILVRAFSPYVGATMASASARGVCQRCAPGASSVDHAGVTEIIAALEPGLHVFIGREKTRHVVRELWAGIGALGGDDMKSARVSSWVFGLYAAVVVAVFVGRQLGPESYLFTRLLSPPRFSAFTSLVKLAPQAVGAVFAGRCALRYDKANAARRGWWLMSAWLAGWFAGQVVLASYERILGVPAPLPSIGDVFFTLGCILLILGLFTFVTAYRRSGFAAGNAREDVLIGLAATCLLGVVGYAVLVPVAMTPAPIAERVVNVGYPVIDLLTLIPAAILLRITLAFRGGQVWRVWGAILAGVVLTTTADVAFADVSPAHVEAVGWLVDLSGALAYACCAYGTWLQFELVTE